MARRPGNIDLKSAQEDHYRSPASPRNAFHLDLPSPRVGEIPPALSPLDAFALQSRMLAKKFEESQQQGRRMSRLPHDDIANQFSKRPGFFRTRSSESASIRQESGDEADQDQINDMKQHVTPKEDRPVSHYPRFSSITTGTEDSRPNTIVGETWYNCDEGPRDQNYFGNVPRASSPEPFESRDIRNDNHSPAPPSLTNSYDSLQSSQIRTNTDESSSPRKRGYGLAPPKPLQHPRSNHSTVSIRSVIDSADEDGDARYDLAPPRKFSNSSGFSGPQSPLTPDIFPGSCRSPSGRSEKSFVSGHFQRPSLNFSRPLSSSSNKLGIESGRPSLSSRPSYESRPSFEFPIRKSSLEREKSPLRQGSSSTTSSDIETPRIRASDGVDNMPMNGEQAAQGAESYIYAKYSLPRGRMVERGSLGSRDSWMKHQFAWEELRPSSPLRQVDLPRSSEDAPRTRTTSATGSPVPSKSRSRSAGPARSTPPSRQEPIRVHTTTTSIASESTDRTIRAHSRNSPSADIVNMAPEEHLEKGIQCHSNGSLSKSTYHLRLAARAGLPTAMLLYALACRHGWGMRPNQPEGVMWLKRAVDSSSIEVLSDSDPLTSSHDSGLPNSPESKARKSQFALAIYELGISYMNGWGIPKDKALAVRCFEIAGSWGDLDALAEAGFCYTEGVGCKKDLKKAAGFYRRAADGGMSMAGNSW